MTVYKYLYRIGFLAYAALFLLSILFYKERTVFVDIAYHMFVIIKDGDFAIQNYRFAAMFTQLFPLIGSKLSLPLDTIALLYSLGFILFYFICYCICGLALKNYHMALVLLLFNILFVSDSFYWMQSELPQGAAIMMMVLAYVSNRNIKEMSFWGIGVAIIGTVAFAFAHPMLLFPFAYAMGFFFLKNEATPSRKNIMIIFISYACCVAAKSVFFRTPYDSEAMSHGGNVIKLFPNYINLYSNKQFIYECLHNYYWIPICSAGIVILYASKKDWLQLLLFAATFFAYLLLVNISLPGADVVQFYIENLYLPLGIIIGIPLVYEVLPLLNNRKLGIAALAAIIITGSLRIYRSHELYTRRLNWERSVIAQNIDKKLIIDQSLIPPNTPYLMTWGTPYEFWLLSTMEQGRSASILYNAKVTDLEWATPEKQGMVTTWGVFNYKDLPKRYFRFNDTVQAYTLIKP